MRVMIGVGQSPSKAFGGADSLCSPRPTWFAQEKYTRIRARRDTRISEICEWKLKTSQLGRLISRSGEHRTKT